MVKWLNWSAMDIVLLKPVLVCYMVLPPNHLIALHKYTAYSICKGYLAHFIGNLAIFPNINPFMHVSPPGLCLNTACLYITACLSISCKYTTCLKHCLVGVNITSCSLDVATTKLRDKNSLQYYNKLFYIKTIYSQDNGFFFEKVLISQIVTFKCQI